MVSVIDSDFTSFFEDSKDKIIVLYGAGIKAINLIENYKLDTKQVYIVDSNENLHQITIADTVYPVHSIDTLHKVALSEDIVIMITVANYAMEILELLDRVDELDGIHCYLLSLLQEKCKDDKFLFSTGIDQIPKKIHYCWFGNTEKNEIVEECVDSWKKQCPDYEIICWNESNYDITKNEYMYQAYINKKYGFVPDYARLDIVYNEGGIYLDADVKLVSTLDPLLKDEMFFGMLYEYRSGFGLGFGAKKGHSLIKKLRDVYDKSPFVDKEGNLNLTPCASYQDPILKEYGFSLENKYEVVNGIVCYPSSVFNPKGVSGLALNYTENTVSEHLSMVSWQSESAREEFERYRRNIMKRIGH